MGDAEEPQLGRLKRHKDLVILVLHAGGAFALQHTDDLEVLVADLDCVAYGRIAIEEVHQDRVADNRDLRTCLIFLFVEKAAVHHPEISYRRIRERRADHRGVDVAVSEFHLSVP